MSAEKAISAPTQIGPYRILEEIGQGGMGVVYKAEQREPVRRMVALKVVQAGIGTKEVLARFQLERRALAAMNHRCIAKVLDAGATDKGEPFFVMELVASLPITDYCDKHKLALNDRLRLFQLVCEGVQHRLQVIGVRSQPHVGNSQFAFTCRGAPPSAFGVFGVSLAFLLPAIQYCNTSVWISLNQDLILAAVVGTSQGGYSEWPVAIPPNPALTGLNLASQHLWFEPAGGCSGSAALIATLQQ